jgi:hypothetical protein
MASAAGRTSLLHSGPVFLPVSWNRYLHLLPPWRQGQRGDKFGGGVGALICVEDLKSLCVSLIANSLQRRFCTKTLCTVKSHRTQKTILKANTLHLIGQKYQARLEPNLLTSKLPPDVTVKSIAVQEKEIGVWAAYFAGLEAKPEIYEILGSSPNMGSLRGWEEVEKLSLARLSQAEANRFLGGGCRDFAHDYHKAQRTEEVPCAGQP